MPAKLHPLNALGAAGICASLALLGWEINTHDHPHFLSITVTGNHDSDSDDHILPAPDESHHGDGLDDHNSHPNGRPDDDGDFYGGHAKPTDPDAAIPT